MAVSGCGFWGQPRAAVAAKATASAAGVMRMGDLLRLGCWAVVPSCRRRFPVGASRVETGWLGPVHGACRDRGGAMLTAEGHVQILGDLCEAAVERPESEVIQQGGRKEVGVNPTDTPSPQRGPFDQLHDLIVFGDAGSEERQQVLEGFSS